VVNNWGELGKWVFHVCRDPQVLGAELGRVAQMQGSVNATRFSPPWPTL